MSAGWVGTGRAGRHCGVAHCEEDHLGAGALRIVSFCRDPAEMIRKDDIIYKSNERRVTFHPNLPVSWAESIGCSY